MMVGYQPVSNHVERMMKQDKYQKEAERIQHERETVEQERICPN